MRRKSKFANKPNRQISQYGKKISQYLLTSSNAGDVCERPHDELGKHLPKNPAVRYLQQMDLGGMVSFAFKTLLTISWLEASLPCCDYSRETLASWQYSWIGSGQDNDIISKSPYSPGGGWRLSPCPGAKDTWKDFVFKLKWLFAAFISPWNYWIYFALLIVFLKCTR